MDELKCIIPFFPKEMRNNFPICQKVDGEKLIIYEKYVYDMKFGKSSEVKFVLEALNFILVTGKLDFHQNVMVALKVRSLICPFFHYEF